MVFSSFVFLGVFLPLVIALYYIIPNRKWRNGVLLIASLFFYAWGEPIWIAGMLAVTLVVYFAGLVVRSKEGEPSRKLPLVITLVACLGNLFVFKYLGLAVETLNYLPFADLTVPGIDLPVGISFYTFQAMTYIIDVYRGNAKVQKNYFKLLLYVAMFPQLVAGPIVRYSDVDDMIDNRKETARGFVDGFVRFAIGFGKKILLANSAASVADTILTDGISSITSAGAWVGIFMYALQIYFDFSGYSDMAIGMGKMFGFEFKENFNYPYIARDIKEFWARWHMSLGTFFRDYVYIPLGGNRRHQYLNITVVWALTGLWHGASWNFMIWGLFFGFILVLEKNLAKIGAQSRRIPVLSNILTLIIVLFSYSLFYFTDMSSLGVFLKAMFGLGNATVAMSAMETTAVFSVFWLIPVMVIACTPLPAMVANKLVKKNAFGYCVRIIFAIAVIVLAFVVLVNQGYNPFIYFRF